MQQERHAIVAQRASPLRPTSRLKARHLFRGFQKNGYFGYFFISSYNNKIIKIEGLSLFHRIVWRICRISYVVYRMGIYGRQNTVCRNPD